jgi:aminoglycoside phosphotransferase (APT) family kinase protein
MSEILNRQEAFSGTKAVSEKLMFDVGALEAYLKTRIEGFTTPLKVSQFKGGQSNPTYKLETPNRAYVLRRKPPGTLLPSAHAVDREFKVIAALHAQGFPVAKPYLYEPDSQVIGTPFYVMSCEEGRIIWDPALKDVQIPERQAIYKGMLGTLAQLHNYVPQEIGLGDYGKGENYVSRQTERWTKQYQLSETTKIDEMDRLIAWLPAHIPPQQATRLVHGDYRLDNCVLHATEPHVQAVLDWELSTLGDPLADFTYYLLAWVMPKSADGSGTGTLEGEDITLLGIPTLQEQARRYSALTGFDALPHLNTPRLYFARHCGARARWHGRQC